MDSLPAFCQEDRPKPPVGLFQRPARGCGALEQKGKRVSVFTCAQLAARESREGGESRTLFHDCGVHRNGACKDIKLSLQIGTSKRPAPLPQPFPDLSLTLLLVFLSTLNVGF